MVCFRAISVIFSPGSGGSGCGFNWSNGGFGGSGLEQTAINNLNLFISQVEAQRGKMLYPEDADALSAGAQKIIEAI